MHATSLHFLPIIIFSCLLTFDIFAQPAHLLSGRETNAVFSPDIQRHLDSLKLIISENKHDTSVSGAYLELGEILHVFNIDTMKYFCETAKEIAIKNLSDLSISSAEKHAFRITLAASLNNIGYVYDIKGDNKMALEYYKKSLAIEEETGLKEDMASSLNNIGYLYLNMGDSSLALETYHKSLKIEDEIGNTEGVAYSLDNIGNIYQNQGNISKALEYYQKSLKKQEETGNKQGIASSLNNIGRIILEYGDTREAKTIASKSLKLSTELGIPAIIRNASELLRDVHKKENNYEEALKMHELYIMMRDSVNNQEIQYIALKNEAKHQIEKREAKIKLLDKENEIKEAQIVYHRNMVISGVIGIVVLILLLWRLYANNVRLKLAARTLEASNKTISMQKYQVESNLALQTDKNANLRKQLNNIKNPGSHIITLNSSGLRIDSNKIYYIESQNRYVLLSYHAEKVVSIYERTSLKDFIRNLPPDFVQIHRSYCINITKIKSRAGKYKLIMNDNKPLPISKSYVNDFDNVISQH